MDTKLSIAFFGSSLVSSYWNGAATYYRGIIKGLHALGHRITFFEPDAYDRQKHRDIGECLYAQAVVYPADETGARYALAEARNADIVVKASGVGVLDAMLEEAVLDLKTADNRVLFWDVDAPATLDKVNSDPGDPFRSLIPEYDCIMTYGGGAPVVSAYESLHARRCVPVYNALDPDTHFPVTADPKYGADLSFLGNCLPDRETRAEEFFFKTARLMTDRRFLLGGSGWDHGAQNVPNVRYLGHVYTHEHNRFNCSALAVLNVDRESMARFGFSPPTRIFEAAGAAACIVTDEWKGIEYFLAPNRECLVARNGDEVAGYLATLTKEQARAIGEAARGRVLSEHTYSHRAAQVQTVVMETLGIGGA